MTDAGSRQLYAVAPPLQAYFRPGYNDHKVTYVAFTKMADAAVLAGLTFDPCLEERQDDLLAVALGQGRDAVLDPRTAELALAGGHSPKLGGLPWGSADLQSPAELSGPVGTARVHALAAKVIEKKYTAVLAPTHFITSATDPWLPIDRALTVQLREALNGMGGHEVRIFYPLIAPGELLRRPAARSALKAVLRSVPLDALWIYASGFGTSKSGPVALRGYVHACRDLRGLGVPLVAAHSGTVGVALLSTGAVDGVESGITLGEQVDFQRLTRPRRDGKAFSPPPRVYVKGIQTLLSMKEAHELFAKPGMKTFFACRDESCCRHGADDMMRDPRSHFMKSRVAEVADLSAIPAHLRAGQYLELVIRPASDAIIRAEKVLPSLAVVRRRLEGWRLTLSDLEREQVSAPVTPPSRVQWRR